MSKTFAIGIIGDSHLMRMAEFMSPDFNVYGRGGEMALNWTQYQKAMSDNDFVVIFLGGNDITGRLGEPAPSSLKGLCNNMREMDVFCKANGTTLISCDIVPRMANMMGTDHANHRLIRQFKSRHIVLDGFPFKNGDDGVHLTEELYEQLATVFQEKIIAKCSFLFEKL